MERAIVNGVDCVVREVSNIEVYKILSSANINGIPPVEKIEDNYVYYKYIEGVSLRAFIDKHGGVSGLVLNKFIFDVINILNDLSNFNIIHKDLKPENIIVATNGDIYLIDFNVSRIDSVKESDTSLFGTRGYASPEHFGYSPTTFKSDMYSLGVIIKEIDKHNEYELIADKCMKLDPKDRFESYDELLSHIVNSVKPTQKDNSVKKVINTENNIGEKIIRSVSKPKIFKAEDKLKDYYSKLVIGIFSSLYIFWLLIMVLDGGNFNTFINGFLTLYACYFFLDIIDIIRILILRPSVKTIKKRALISAIIFYAIVTILIIDGFIN